MMEHLLYIDPGSGSYVIQAIVAGVTGAVFFFKNFRLYVKDKVSRLFGKKQSPHE